MLFHHIVGSVSGCHAHTVPLFFYQAWPQQSCLLTLHFQREAGAARLALRIRGPTGVSACTLSLQVRQVHDFRALARHTHALQQKKTHTHNRG